MLLLQSDVTTCVCVCVIALVPIGGDTSPITASFEERTIHACLQRARIHRENDI